MSRRKVEVKHAKRMKREACFNVFLFITEGEKARVVNEIGVVHHLLSGTDAGKLAFLQSNVDADWPLCRRHPLPDRFWVIDMAGQKHRGVMTYETFQKFVHDSQGTFLEEVVWAHYKWAPRDPIMCITPIVNGKVRIEGMTDLGGNHL